MPLRTKVLVAMSDLTRKDPAVERAVSELRPEGDVLCLESVTKTYPGVRALDRVDFTCRAGEIHALVGENGSGKSTLIKVASGAVRPDSGTVVIGGGTLVRSSPRASRRLGLLTAYQDTSLVGDLSVSDNVVLSCPGVRPLPFLLGKVRTASLLEKYELPFTMGTLVRDLSPAARQMLEVVRALIHEPRVLLLDEPTAALDAGSIERLDAMLKDARRTGIGIVYISHRLDEVERLADRVTILRDGAVKGSYAGGNWNAQAIVDLMVGVPTDMEFPARPEVSSDAPVALEVCDLRGSGFRSVDLQVRTGEIVGLAGAEGNGQRELVRAIVGLQPSRGTIAVNGVRRAIRSPRAALRAGIQFLSGDRAAEAAFASLSVMQNSTIAVADDLGPLHLVMRSRERKQFRVVADRLHIARASADQPMSELSGGNQQKTVLSRSILRPGRLIIVDEPTAGVDARARLDIYRAINENALNGAGVLVCSSDSAELAGLCNRVYAVSRGRIVDEIAGERMTEAAIVDAFVRPSHRSTAEAAADHGAVGTGRRSSLWPGSGALGPSWGPLGFIALLIVLVGIYATSKSSVFLGESNLTNLFVSLLPVVCVALGEQYCLISGGMDISVGSTMSVSVVIASFLVTSNSVGGVLPGCLLILLVGLGVGAVNWFVVRKLNVNPLIGTIAMLGILQGIAIEARPIQGGIVGQGLSTLLLSGIGPIPWALLVLAAVAVLGDLWQMRTSPGLFMRAGGRNEEMTRRNGIRVEWLKFSGFAVAGVVAALAGLFVAAQIGVGDSTAGGDFALPAFAACFIGGAGLLGGRGSFVGALLGSAFFTLLTNVAPLVNIQSSWTQIVTGGLTILAIVAYSFERAPWSNLFAQRRATPTD
jgi:ribose transport system ATP-binding protein